MTGVPELPLRPPSPRRPDRLEPPEVSTVVARHWVRSSAGLTSLKERLLAAGMLTGREIAAQLGVRRTTIGRWRREGRLENRA